MRLIDLCLNFLRKKWMMTSFKFFFLTIIHISNSIEPTNVILGTNVQLHKIHLLIRMKVTLKDDEGHKWRSKVTKKWTNGYISQTITFTDIILGTKVQYNKRHLMTLAYLTIWPWLKWRSQLKVKDHRRGGVCVLWMLPVIIFFLEQVSLFISATKAHFWVGLFGRGV